MKEIKIYLKSGKEIIIKDENEMDNLEYSKKLNEILKSEKINIVEFSEGVLNIRPSSIDLIYISDRDDTINIIPKDAFT